MSLQLIKLLGVLCQRWFILFLNQLHISLILSFLKCKNNTVTFKIFLLNSCHPFPVCPFVSAMFHIWCWRYLCCYPAVCNKGRSVWREIKFNIHHFFCFSLWWWQINNSYNVPLRISSLCCTTRCLFVFTFAASHSVTAQCSIYRCIHKKLKVESKQM